MMRFPWTRHYPPTTSADIPAITWPHLPAFIAEAINSFRDRPAFTLFLPRTARRDADLRRRRSTLG